MESYVRVSEKVHGKFGGKLNFIGNNIYNIKLIDLIYKRGNPVALFCCG